MKFTILCILSVLLCAPCIARGQSLTRVGGNSGSAPYRYISLEQQAAIEKRQAEDAKIREANAKIEEANRKLTVAEAEQYLNEDKKQHQPHFARADAGEVAAEQARQQQMAKQIAFARNNQKKSGPSAEFRATQARFAQAERPKAVESVQSAQLQEKAPGAVAEKPARQLPTMTTEQQELIRLELAECQRSGRTPDQLTPTEIAAFKEKAGVRQ